MEPAEIQTRVSAAAAQALTGPHFGCGSFTALARCNARQTKSRGRM